MKKMSKFIRSRFISDETGQALLLVLVLLVLGSLTIVPVLSLMSTALKTGAVYEDKTNKLYACDAGVEDAIWQIQFDRLPILFGDENCAYDFSSNCSYELGDAINGYTVNVNISNVWIPSNTTLDALGLTPAAARAAVDRDITDNTTNRLVVTGTATDDDTYRIKIDFYSAEGDNSTMEFSSIGVWLPHGYTYDGACNLEQSPYSFNPPSTSPHPGGQAVVWDFSSDPVEFDELPPDGTYSVQVSFDYTADEAGTRPVAVGWVVTHGDLSGDIPIAWDIDTKIYKIVSTAGDMTVEAYPSRCDMRQLGAAFQGDYVAIGNTLMRDTPPIFNIRDTLDSESTADTQNDDLSYRIPMDATVVDAYLYWSGWFKCDTSHPNATVWADSCSNLDNWTRSGSDWYDGGSDIEGHYDGDDDAHRYLTLTSPVDLSGRTEGSVVVGWEYSADGNLEPLSDAVNGDALMFELYNGTDWSDPVTVFENDLSDTETYYIVLDNEYLTSNFKIRFYLHGFGGSGEYCQIDDFHIGDVADTSITFEISDGDAGTPDYAGSLSALEFSVLGNAANGEYSFSCMQNVKTLVQTYSLEGTFSTTGNAEYTVGGVLSDTGEHWSYAGWSLIIIYSSPDTAGHQLYKFDRFAFCDKYDILDFDFDDEPGGVIDGFIVPEQIEGETNAAKLTCFVGEGDNAWYEDFIAFNAPEAQRSNPMTIQNQYKLWDGITTTQNNNANRNNVWNSKFKISETGTSTVDGIDIDTFYITWDSGLLHADDTEATIDIYSDYENFNLIYLILSVRSKTTIGGTTHYMISGS
jgi:Flp pilus assembly pilin Flp